MKLLIKKLDEKAVVPKRATQFSAGYDLSACTDEPITINPNETIMIHTGVSMQVQGETDVALFIYARSSLASKFGIAPANCVGVVDWDYTGEIMVPLHNSGTQPYTISPCERIAQICVAPIFTPYTQVVDELSQTDRGAGGFGSTGTN